MPASAGSAFPPLRCPLDRQPLDVRLACSNGHTFPLANAIPRLQGAGMQYADAFGEQWNRYRVTQLDSYTHTTITRDRLRRCLGDELWQRLQAPEPLQVLETGCGAGRFTEVLLGLPAARVTSIDLSSAVDANQTNFPQSDRHRIVQCDINALPFDPESFDIVLCLGVVQHTPDPEATIAALYGAVKPNGSLVIDHYAPSLSHYTKLTALLLRPMLKRLPPRLGTRATEILTNAFFPLHRAVRRRRWMQTLLSRVSPLLTYFQAYPQLDDRLQYEWALVDTHDHLTDFYKHLRTVGEVERALVALGAADVRAWKGGNGVEARCRRPSQ